MIKKNTTPKTENEALEYFCNGTIEGPILDKAIDDIKNSGIPFSLLRKYQIKIFNDDRNVLIGRLGFASLNGHNLMDPYKLVEFPFFNEKSETGHYYMYKVVPSISDEKGKECKYLLPKGKKPIPYILPEVWAIKNKPNKPIWFTEGIKKDLKLFQQIRHAISLSGVWNFKPSVNSENGHLYLFEELESFKWDGRTVYLGFDSDLWTNPSVRYALYELAFKLYSRNAIVKVAVWKGEKGIDDFLTKTTK